MSEEDNLLRVARPTINVTGEDDPRLASGLLKLAISENTQGLFRCEAIFGNWDVSDNPTGFLYFDRRKLDSRSSSAPSRCSTGGSWDSKPVSQRAVHRSSPCLLKTASRTYV